MAPKRPPKTILIAISLLILKALLFLGLVGESEVREVRRAFIGLRHVVVLVLAAVPVADPQAVVGVRELLVDLLRVPGLGERRRIVRPNVDAHGVRAALVPNLDGLDLLRVVRLSALI